MYTYVITNVICQVYLNFKKKQLFYDAHGFCGSGVLKKNRGNGLSLLCKTQIDGGDSKGCWRVSPGGYFPHVWHFSGNSWKAGLSQGSQPEHLHVASSFFTCWPQCSQTVYVAPPGSQREDSSQQGKNCVTFYDLVVEVTWHQFCSLLLVKLITSLLIFKGRGYRPHFFMGEMSKNWWPCFETTPKFSAQMSLYPRGYLFPLSLKLLSLSTLYHFVYLSYISHQNLYLILLFWFSFSFFCQSHFKIVNSIRTEPCFSGWHLYFHCLAQGRAHGQCSVNSC